MTRANICVCGHIMSEHGGKKIGSKYFPCAGVCTDSYCSCQLFKFDHLEPLGRQNKSVLRMSSLNNRGQPYGTQIK